MKDFRSYQVTVEFYRLSRSLKLPKHLKDQLNRAASSIVLNLAEGYGRSSHDDRLRFFHIAMGSIRESQAILDLADYPEAQILEVADKLAAHTFKLIWGKRW